MFDDPEPSTLEIDLGGPSTHDLASQPSIPSGHDLASATDDVSDHDLEPTDAGETRSPRAPATIPSEPLSRDSITVLAADVAIHDLAGHGLASAPDLELDDPPDLPRDTLAPTDDLSTLRPPDGQAGPPSPSDDGTVQNDPEDPS